MDKGKMVAVNENETEEMTNPTICSTREELSPVQIRRDAQRFPRIKSYSEEDAMRLMSALIVKVYIYLGRKAPDRKDVSFLAKQVLYEIYRDLLGLGLKYITFAEVERAIIRKVIDNPENIFGISVSLLMSAINEYAKTEGTEAALKIFEEEAQDQRKLLDDFFETDLAQSCTKEMLSQNQINK